jgi:hypothetical protein
MLTSRMPRPRRISRNAFGSDRSNSVGFPRRRRRRTVRQDAGEILRHAGSERARERARRVGLERHEVDGAEAHPDAQARRLGADALDDLAQEARPVLEAAAVGAGTRDRAEELVAQVAVAGLHVDEVEAARLRLLRGAHEILDERRISSSSMIGWSGSRTCDRGGDGYRRGRARSGDGRAVCRSAPSA